MGPLPQHMIPLARAVELEESSIGGKATKLAQPGATGVRVPDGVCETRSAVGGYLCVVTVGVPEFELKGIS